MTHLKKDLSANQNLLREYRCKNMFEWMIKPTEIRVLGQEYGKRSISKLYFSTRSYLKHNMKVIVSNWKCSHWIQFSMSDSNLPYENYDLHKGTLNHIISNFLCERIFCCTHKHIIVILLHFFHRGRQWKSFRAGQQNDFFIFQPYFNVEISFKNATKHPVA